MQPAPPLDVVTFGETMAMFIADESGPLAEAAHFSRALAGADSNVAIGLARLGLKVAWASRLGTDSFGDYVLASLAREGIDLSQVARDGGRGTGFMLKSRAPRGADPKTEYHRRGSAASALSLADFDAGFFLSARHLHATGITPAISDSAAEFSAQAIATMRAGGRSISFDPNLRPSLWPGEAVMRARINALAVQAHWVLPGLEEGHLLTGCEQPQDIAAFYLDQGVEAVAVKLGAQGAYVASAQGFRAWVPGVPVADVVDTVGAGDAFAVGLVSARLEGRDWQSAAARGNWFGARAVQVLGDSEGLPKRSELPAGL